MLPDRVSNPGPLTYESGALPIALCGQVVVSVTWLVAFYPRVGGGNLFYLYKPDGLCFVRENGWGWGQEGKKSVSPVQTIWILFCERK